MSLTRPTKLKKVVVSRGAWTVPVEGTCSALVRLASCFMAKYLGQSTIPFNRIEEQIFDDHVRNCAVGIDCHRDSYHVYFLNLNSVTNQIQERYCKFGTLPRDVVELTAFLKQAESDFRTSIELIILESTGPYSRTLFESLGGVWGTCMINPAEFSKYGKKTDKFDARKMSILALQGLFGASFLSSEMEERLKLSSRACVRARRGVTRESNSLGALLMQCNIGITRSEARVSLLSVSGREILEAIISGEKIPRQCAKAAKYYDPERIHDSGERAQKRMQKHLALVDALEGVADLSEHMRQVIAMKYKTLEQFERFYETGLNMLSNMLSQYEAEGQTGMEAVDRLMTIPSIGPKASMFLVAESGLRIIERFGGPKLNGADAFTSYCGFNPSRQYSGDKQTSARKAAPGNTHIRSLLIECGQSLLKSSHPLGDRCRSLERRNGGSRNSVARNIAVCAAGGKLARAAYWVLFKQEFFNDEKYDYTAVLRDKEKRLSRIMKDFSAVADDLKLENKVEASNAIGKAVAKMTGTEFVLSASDDDLFAPIDSMGLTGRTKGALERLGCRKFTDIWALLSVQRLRTQKGIGPKAYDEIIERCLALKYIERVE